jgi:hypothetical protein
MGWTQNLFSELFVEVAGARPVRAQKCPSFGTVDLWPTTTWASVWFAAQVPRAAYQVKRLHFLALKASEAGEACVQF